MRKQDRRMSEINVALKGFAIAPASRDEFNHKPHDPMPLLLKLEVESSSAPALLPREANAMLYIMRGWLGTCVDFMKGRGRGRQRKLVWGT